MANVTKVGEWNNGIAHIETDATDKKGRALGYRAVAGEYPGTDRFVARSFKLVGGERFGATPEPKFFDTLEEAMAAAMADAIRKAKAL